ncbi:MAG: flagellar hook-basal body protein [Proteobacteria bacterium]|nr:flagellar hook-basal body protein [Pseudomonadota bacterium]
MDRGTYSAASGGLLQLRKLEVVNNNLANVNTAGFKRELIVGDTTEFDQTLASIFAKDDPYAKGDHDRTPGTTAVRAVTDFSPGPIENTGNPFDLALRNPKDFFAIQTAGGTEYTRAGDFTLNAEGKMVTKDGALVLGDGGEISISGPNVLIEPNGTVKVNGQPAAKIQVVRISDTNQLERVGNSRFKLGAGAGAEAVEPDVVPQALERSNVSAITGVIDLILSQRGFEMYTKSAETIDQMNQAAITQVGRK